MCGGCVGTEYPERGTTCLEGGSFLLNFVGCAQCGRRDFVLLSNRAAGLHGGEEIVTYDHLCKNCHHLIARHEYTFSVVDDYQEYTMLCLLCGRAEDSISILPDDPRQMTPSSENAWMWLTPEAPTCPEVARPCPLPAAGGSTVA